MAEKLLTKTEGWYDGLPPDHCWLIRPEEKMKTPVDDRGLVDERKLILGVSAYIKPKFLWPDNLTDHHKYWFAEWYAAREEVTGGRVPANQFCQLPTSRLWMPRMLHTVLHHVTRPPSMPPIEVMRYQIAAWGAAHNLLTSIGKELKADERVQAELAKENNTAEREQVIRLYLKEQFDRNFRGISRHLDALEGVPSEYWVFDPHSDPFTIFRQIRRYKAKTHHRIGGEVTFTSRGRRRISLANAAVQLEAA